MNEKNNKKIFLNRNFKLFYHCILITNICLFDDQLKFNKCFIDEQFQNIKSFEYNKRSPNAKRQVMVDIIAEVG